MSSEQHPYRPTLAPVPEGVLRPLWSVMIPTYNSGEYLRETLTSVLAQAPEPEVMQIAVVDDCSPEGSPAALIEEVGRGRIEFYQQPENVGAAKNFQTCLERSRGKLIHLLHQDDGVRVGFYRKMQQAFSEHPEIGAAFCRNAFMDEHGNWKNLSDLEQPESGILTSRWLERIASVCCIQTPAIAVRREVYEKLGGYDFRLPKAAHDWEMWVRIAANYPMWYEVEPLAMYRQHSSSLTKRYAHDGNYIKQLYEAIEIFQGYVADKIPSQIYTTAKQNCAFFSLEIADSLLAEGDIPGAIAQIQLALSFNRSFRVIRSASRLMLLSLILSLRQRVPAAR